MNFYELIESDNIFWFCALVGTGMFGIQFLLSLIGLGDFESSAESHSADAGNFKWMSRQALAGFLMMFGWTALTSQKEFGIEGPMRIVIAGIAGIVAIYAATFLLSLTKRFHSSGTVFNVDFAVGLEAVVYHRIPAEGIGKVSVTVDNFTRELDALSNKHVELLSFTRVKITQKVDDKTVFVEAI